MEREREKEERRRAGIITRLMLGHNLGLVVRPNLNSSVEPKSKVENQLYSIYCIRVVNIYISSSIARTLSLFFCSLVICTSTSVFFSSNFPYFFFLSFFLFFHHYFIHLHTITPSTRISSYTSLPSGCLSTQ